MYQIAKHEKDIDWTPADLPGVSFKLLSRNPDTGASVALYRFDPGSSVPKHWHSESDETGYVLEGEFIDNGKAYGPGSVFYGQSGTTHGPHLTNTGCLVLFVLSGKLDFFIAGVPILSLP